MSAVAALALGLAVLALALVALVALGAVTARPTAEAVPTRDGYFDRWAPLHGGYDPRTGNVLARGWLMLAYLIARPLARRGVQPDVVTLSSLWLAGLVLLLAELGGRWWIAAGLTMVLSALFDSLDGCLAVLEDRVSRWGYVLDSIVDRASDGVYLLAVVAVGCPPPLAVALLFGFFLLEYLRARSGNAGGDAVGRITIGERSTRVIMLSLTIGFCGIVLALSDVLAVLGPAVLLVMTLVALGQLGVTVRRQLLALPGGTPPG